MLDEMDKCNDFFADRQEILLRDGRQIIQVMYSCLLYGLLDYVCLLNWLVFQS